MCPGAFNALAGYPDAHIVFFAIAIIQQPVNVRTIVVRLLTLIMEIAVAEFEETKILCLALHIVLNAFQTTIKKGLTHHSEVL